MTETETPATKPTKAKLARLCELREKKRQLESEARQLGKEVDLISDEVLTWMEEQERSSARVYGFQVTIEEGRPYVSWKDEYVREMGAEAATRLTAEATRPPRLIVQPPA